VLVDDFMQGNCFTFLLLTQCFRSQVFKVPIAHQTLKPMVHGTRRFLIDLRGKRQQLIVRQLAHFPHDFGNFHAISLALPPRLRKNGLC
jgi:hypothetical protein